MIRKAEKTDIKQIAEIYRDMHLIHKEIRADYFKLSSIDSFFNNLNNLFKNNDINIIVYEENEEIKGYACFFLKQRDESDEMHKSIKRCFIEHFAVHQNYRQKGIGKSLFDYIKNFAVQNNCNSIELGVWYENYDAVNFCGSVGFVPRMYKMEMKLK